MPSINDVYNQLVTANGTLNQVHTDLIAEKNATDQVNTSIGQLDTDLKNGFQSTDSDLVTIAKIETEAVRLLFHLTQQADTIICVLEKISKNTCELLNQATTQTALQTRIRDDAAVVREITESSHPGAALERDRLAALRAQIEKCCPPEPTLPACSYQPCPRPEPIGEPQLPDTSTASNTSTA